ncbi:OmpP1/FadL family transporter [Kordia sp.]|uniref:OmpP1/FadL family transporter n=1 Tax=Kordia sp. TaxID=1965332 RepID=UPI003B5B5D43
MKKVFILFIGVLAMSVSNAQNVDDIVRFSSEDLNGTARFKAMSGAFGALGGDFSAFSINPAGSAIFSTSEVTVSLSNYNNDNDVSYFNSTVNRNDSEFDLNQAGIVFVFNNMDNGDWRKISLGLNVQNNGNYYNNYLAAGRNNNSRGIADYFVILANGQFLGDIAQQIDESDTDTYLFLGENIGFEAQQGFLGYEGFIINPVTNDNDNTAYTSNADYSDGADHEYLVQTSGFNRKYTFNVAAQYRNNLYLGLNINSHDVDYRERKVLTESPVNLGSGLQYAEFSNELYTYGTGISFQVGAILKLQNIRLGGSYQSPTWYSLNDELIQGLSTDFRNPTSPTEILRRDIFPNVVNAYREHRIVSPGNITGSFAYIFGKKGLISFDYSLKDYANAKLRPTNDFLATNNNIETQLQAASTYRIGGEYRIKQFSLRGGYRFEESPYQDGTTIGDLEGYSLGLGYNFGSLAIDLAYDRSEQVRNPQLFQVGLVDRANINNINSNVTLSVSFKL